jgi:ribosomal protein S18 acetylase RimI-like enzyme
MGFSRNLKIRHYHESDLERLMEIQHDAFQEIFASLRQSLGEDVFARLFGPEGAKQAEHLKSIVQPDSEYEIYVAEMESNQIAAFAAVTMKEDEKIGEIGLNAVAPEFSGNGIGGRLYARLIERMRESGMTLAQVSTGLDHAHEPARRAYEKTGFYRGVASVNYYMKL